MTITLSWWWLPIACVVAGAIAAEAFARRNRGLYDFGWLLISFGCLVTGIAAALGIVVGKLVLG